MSKFTQGCTEGWESLQKMAEALTALDIIPDRKYAFGREVIERSHAPYTFKELLPAPSPFTRIYVGEARDLRNSPYEEPRIDIPMVVFDLHEDGTFLVDYRGPWPPQGNYVNYKGRFNSKGEPIDSMALPIYQLIGKQEHAVAG